MDKQSRLNALRGQIKENHERLTALRDSIHLLTNYETNKIEFFAIEKMAKEAVLLEGLNEDLKIEAKSLQEEIDLEARIDNL